SGRVVVISADNGAEISASPYRNVNGEWRRGLVWNGTTYTQGVVRTDAGTDFPSELQSISTADTATLFEAISVVPSSGKTVYFFDIARHDATGSGVMYYATDTSGALYRVRGSLFSSVYDGAVALRTDLASIKRIVPNPMRDGASITVSLVQADDVTLELIDARGARALLLYDGRMSAGEHEKRMDVSRLAGGVYYVVMTGSNGERQVSPIVLTR
ncbi:MAG: T9SS type A sorting domain-containing protein, partial [bacterium]|nr:T9SS type A sorting domain-containing protein [Candidatus Kapabacteria bacterium]